MQKMKRDKLFNKFIIITLIISLTISNWWILGKWAISSAMTSELELQTSETKNKNVKFDIGIKEEDKLLHNGQSDINDIITLTSYISVENEGYLKDINIKFSGENGETKNFDIINISSSEENIIKSTSANEIELNQISENKTINLELAIQWNKEILSNISKLNQNNIIGFSATYIDGSGKESKIEKSIIININWKCENEITLESSISRYTNYELEEERGIIITQKISLSQNKEYALPYKNIQLMLNQPEINEKNADEIIIKSENSDIPFEKAEDNKIKIINENKETDGIVENINTNREYEITYIFQNIEMPDEVNINTNIEAIAQIYSSNQEKITQIEYNTTLNEKIGEIVSVKNENIQSISKGNMYANFNNKEPIYYTSYETNFSLEIAYKNQIKNIKIQDEGTYFEDQENQEYECQVIIKSTKINKQEFETILGTEGYIKILDINGNEIGKIDNQTTIDENGDYLLAYPEETTKINMITSEVLKEGKLGIKNTKEIKSNISYTKDDVEKFKNLNDKYSIELIIGDNGKNVTLAEADISRELTETKTEAQVILSTNKLSSISKNENVEIKIELKNNNENSDLYKNPKFEIELPKEISDIEIKDANILFDEELQIEDISKTKINGHIVVTIKLKGIQTKFLLEEYINGTTIVLNTDISVDIKTISKTENIIMKYYNENAVSYNAEGHGEYTSSIEFISPVGMIIGTEISNYNQDGQSIMSISTRRKNREIRNIHRKTKCYS